MRMDENFVNTIHIEDDLVESHIGKRATRHCEFSQAGAFDGTTHHTADRFLEYLLRAIGDLVDRVTL